MSGGVSNSVPNSGAPRGGEGHRHIPLNAQALLDLLPDPACLIHADGAYVAHNPAWCAQSANPVAAQVAPGWQGYIHPDDLPALLDMWRQARRSGAGFDIDLRVDIGNGQRWTLLRARPQSEGGETLWLLTLTDIHASKARKHDLTRQIRLQAGMLNVSPDCIKVLRPDGHLIHMNQAGCDALNVAPDSGFGMDWLSLLPAEVREGGRRALKDANGGVSARFPGASQLPGEAPRAWDNILTPLVDDTGAVEAILCVSRDVTAQRDSEARVELLMNELNHRAKNLLAVIQGLIRRTVPDPGAAFVATLESRIGAIARSQDLLIHGQWSGAPIREVIAAQLAAAGDMDGERLHLTGEAALRLKPKAAETLSLAIYELTTNAIKYGALSNDTGTVDVDWKIHTGDEGDRLHIRWQEKGGPPVVQPTRQGFGSVVVARNPRAVLGGDVTLDFRPEGVVWSLDAPIAALVADDGH